MEYDEHARLAFQTAVTSREALLRLPKTVLELWKPMIRGATRLLDLARTNSTFSCFEQPWLIVCSVLYLCLVRVRRREDCLHTAMGGDQGYLWRLHRLARC